MRTPAPDGPTSLRSVETHAGHGPTLDRDQLELAVRRVRPSLVRGGAEPEQARSGLVVILDRIQFGLLDADFGAGVTRQRGHASWNTP